MIPHGTEPQNRLCEIDRSECVRLLQVGAYVGHLGFMHEGKPMILPVNYLADGDSIVIRTEERGLVSSLDNADVAFEVSEHRVFGGTGWSVLAHGTISRIDDPCVINRLERSQVTAWAWHSAHCWMRIDIQDVSGRQIVDR